MSKIRLMSPELANTIAAGEVIERPSSVIKELVENSIDANSKNIEISVFHGGKDLIIVKDDGEGMDREDAVMAYKRHASSKLKSVYDLMRITTLGFRGEAIPSIASVSKVHMITSSGEGVGTEINSSPDKELEVKDAPLRKGTIFEIKELFFNTPARLKYLKSERTENYSCIEIGEHLALAFPNIAFKFYLDGKEVFHTNGRGDLLETISLIYGNNIAKQSLKIDFEGDGYEVHGYICHPSINYSNRYNMLTFLNNRGVYIYKVQKAFVDAYKDYIPPARYPLVIVGIKVDYSLVDVNVHPSKKEVRLSCEDRLALDIHTQTRKVLFESTRSVFAAPQINKNDVRYLDDSNLNEPSDRNNSSYSSSSFENTLFKEVEPKEIKKWEQPTNMGYSQPVYSAPEMESIFKREEEEGKQKTFIVEDSQGFVETSGRNEYKPYHSIKNPSFPVLYPVGQVLETYIVCDSSDGMYLIDQHAAAERINFEMCRLQFTKKKDLVQPLFPTMIELSHSLMHNLDEKHIAALKELGITVSPFGNNAIKVDEEPEFLSQKQDESVLRDIITLVLEDQKVDIPELERKAIATKACHMSIKANRLLTSYEQQTLIRQLAECENPLNCPHGRPTVIKISKYDIEKLFKRTGF